MSEINTGIFKAYDIRGIYPSELNEDAIYKIGQAFAKLLVDENPGKQLTVFVGRDMRLSGPQLTQKVIDGILSQGVNVDYGDLTSTPSFYYMVANGAYDGGLQVSASHNPQEYNGCKMVRSRAVPISGDTGISAIRDMVVQNNFVVHPNAGVMSNKKVDLSQMVSHQLAEWGIDAQTLKTFNIVIDPANAMGIIDADAIFKVLPGNITKINFELDGTFPAHEADPLKAENLEQLAHQVRAQQADLGIAIDGDGDRIFFVDDQGENIPQEILRGIIAQIVLNKYPQATICYDIRPGKITRDLIEEAGGNPSVTRVGHSLIKEQMIKENSPFSGESSGHFFFRCSIGSFEAPTIFIAMVLKYMSEHAGSISQLIAPYKKYYHSGEINSVVQNPHDKIKQIAQKYSDAQISMLDGVTVTYPEYWFNVRASNTEPKLRLNLEAISAEVMAAKRDEVLAFIRS